MRVQRCAAARPDFYRDELGFQLVKKTVNFDDPHSYHLYFGDETGSPGSLITFFEWPRAERGRLGRGTLESIGLVSPAVSSEQEVEDPDGLRLRLLPGTRARLHDVVAIGNPDLYGGLVDENAPLTFAPPVEETALIGAGITHHVAWRAADDAEQEAWRERLSELGLRPTAQQERKYFRSIYFRMPDAIPARDRHGRPGVPDRREPRRGSGQNSLAAAVARARARDLLERELVPDRLRRKRGSECSPVVRDALERTWNLHAPRGHKCPQPCASTDSATSAWSRIVLARPGSGGGGGCCASRQEYTLWRMYARAMGVYRPVMEALRDPSSITPRQKEIIQLIAAGQLGTKR